jgi:hypothetical protein
MKVLILGATGLVGRNALAQALARPAVTQVIAPTRRPLPKQDKLMNPVAPKLELLLPELSGWGAAAAICATGTRIKKAGSKEAFRSGRSRSAAVVCAAGSPSRHTKLRTRLVHRSIRRCVLLLRQGERGTGTRCSGDRFQVTHYLAPRHDRRRAR